MKEVRLKFIKMAFLLRVLLFLIRVLGNRSENAASGRLVVILCLEQSLSRGLEDRKRPYVRGNGHLYVKKIKESVNTLFFCLSFLIWKNCFDYIFRSSLFVFGKAKKFFVFGRVLKPVRGLSGCSHFYSWL